MKVVWNPIPWMGLFSALLQARILADARYWGAGPQTINSVQCTSSFFPPSALFYCAGFFTLVFPGVKEGKGRGGLRLAYVGVCMLCA